MSLLTKYPRYTARVKLKASFNGLTPLYLAALWEHITTRWSEHHELIAQELGTGETSELRHWLQALVEATYDVENGMVPCETALPGLTELIGGQKSGVRLLYTGLLILSCWEIGLSSRSSESSLTHEAKMAGLSSRALLEILRKAEPDRQAIRGAERPPVPERSTAKAATPVYAIVVSPVGADRAEVNPKAELASILCNRFRQPEREVLLYGMGIHPEDVKLNPLTRDDFVWALMAYVERRRRLQDLWDCVARARPGCLSPSNPFQTQ